MKNAARIAFTEGLMIALVKKLSEKGILTEADTSEILHSTEIHCVHSFTHLEDDMEAREELDRLVAFLLSRLSG